MRPWREPGNNWYQTERWRKLRVQVLRDEPLCRYCKQSGRLVPANVVDHIKPHKGDEGLFFDRENLQGLCKTCHDSAKRLKEIHGYAPGTGVDGQPIDPDHPWNK